MSDRGRTLQRIRARVRGVMTKSRAWVGPAFVVSARLLPASQLVNNFIGHYSEADLRGSLEIGIERGARSRLAAINSHCTVPTSRLWAIAEQLMQQLPRRDANHSLFCCPACVIKMAYANSAGGGEGTRAHTHKNKQIKKQMELDSEIFFITRVAGNISESWFKLAVVQAYNSGQELNKDDQCLFVGMFLILQVDLIQLRGRDLPLLAVCGRARGHDHYSKRYKREPATRTNRSQQYSPRLAM
ncbi:hypothetical protein BaRGS_00024835 [Batillaria attramentaria]|uniref:Uncharacterized protein n=1 Tax=Batillaria attramentaria TaxID=370345 RepID=A0ABD0KAE8_9CAEN